MYCSRSWPYRTGRPYIAALFAVLAVLGSLSCSGGKDRRPERLAILAFENLTGVAGLDWMSRGFAEALRLELAGTAVQPLLVPALRDVPSVTAGRVAYGYYSLERGRLVARVTVQDERKQTVLAASASGAPSELLPLAHAIALRIEPAARDLPTRNAAAFRDYLSAVTTRDRTEAARAFEQAVAADAGFGAAYLGWARMLVSAGDRRGAAGVIASARQNAERFAPLEHAQLDVLVAAFSGDRAAEKSALEALSRVDPADPTLYRTLGEFNTRSHQYREAAKAYEEAVERDPADIASLNQLGYVRAWSGDLEGAVKALSRYRELQPADANPLDSLGDVHYYFSRFKEAERYYRDAHATDPSFLGGGALYKAAWARLMQGDVPGAGQLFGMYLAARQAARDPLIPYRRAQWDYLTGRRREAVARLEQYARNAPPQIASLAFSQLAIWSLEAGDRNRAREFAAKAPGPTALTVLCDFLSQPPAPPSEWAARAGRAFPGQALLRSLALGYALLFSKDFTAAVAPFEQAYAATAPSSSEWPAVPLAWALLESGRLDRAQPLLSVNAAPDAAGDHPLASVSFPRIFYLRGILAAKQGKPADAKASFGTFLRLAGDLPSIFAERDRVEAALQKL